MRVTNYSKKSASYGVPRRQFLNYMAMVSAIPFSSGQLHGKVNTSPKFSAYPLPLEWPLANPELMGRVFGPNLLLGPLELGGGALVPKPFP